MRQRVRFAALLALAMLGPLCVPVASAAQARSISGVTLSVEDSTVVDGVTVSVEGGFGATVTDEDATGWTGFTHVAVAPF